MSETAVPLPADAPALNSTAALRQVLEAEISRIDQLVLRIEQEYRELTARIERCHERRDATNSIRTLILKNISQYGLEDVNRAFDEHADAIAELAVAEHRFEELADRRGEASDQLKALRFELELVGDSNIQSPQAEAVTFRNASRQVFQIIEEERMRIARDMHDGPAQSMSNLVLQAEILERLVHKPEAILHELQDFKNAVRNALDETRQLIFDLRPMTLDDLGLVPTLRKYLKEYSDKHGVPVRFNVVGEERRLPGNTEGTLFRIIQEALTNVQKHAHARGAEVTMSMSKDRVTATIRDDGQGFDIPSVEANLARNRNLGLISMRERAELDRGALEIKSQPGKGTEIRAEFKLQ
ncbi:MAG: sensor histidine kinase [Candidatus Dormibacteraeota bacterium]|nr:sensor histidine kinase [Candidatus Dormibacteraeota bacterium]